MFIIKYHAKGHKSKYFGFNKSVSDKKYAVAFGEGIRERALKLESETCSLVTIPVSELAELIYHDAYIRMNKIEF